MDSFSVICLFECLQVVEIVYGSRIYHVGNFTDQDAASLARWIAEEALSADTTPPATVTEADVRSGAARAAALDAAGRCRRLVLSLPKDRVGRTGWGFALGDHPLLGCPELAVVPGSPAFLQVPAVFRRGCCVAWWRIGDGGREDGRGALRQPRTAEECAGLIRRARAADAGGDAVRTELFLVQTRVTSPVSKAVLSKLLCPPDALTSLCSSWPPLSGPPLLVKAGAPNSVGAERHAADHGEKIDAARLTSNPPSPSTAQAKKAKHGSQYRCGLVSKDDSYVTAHGLPALPKVNFDQLIHYPKAALRAQSYIRQIDAIKPITFIVMGIAVPHFPALENDSLVKLAIRKSDYQLYDVTDLLFNSGKNAYLQKEILRRSILHNLDKAGEEITHQAHSKVCKGVPRKHTRSKKYGVMRLPRDEVSHLPRPANWSVKMCMDWLLVNPPPVQEHDFLLHVAQRWRWNLRDQLGRYNSETEELKAALEAYDAEGIEPPCDPCNQYAASTGEPVTVQIPSTPSKITCQRKQLSNVSGSNKSQFAIFVPKFNGQDSGNKKDKDVHNHASERQIESKKAQVVEACGQNAAGGTLSAAKEPVAALAVDGVAGNTHYEHFVANGSNFLSNHQNPRNNAPDIIIQKSQQLALAISQFGYQLATLQSNSLGGRHFETSTLEQNHKDTQNQDQGRTIVLNSTTGVSSTDETKTSDTKATNTELLLPAQPSVKYSQLVNYSKSFLRAQNYFDIDQIKTIKPLSLIAMSIGTPQFPDLENDTLVKLATQRNKYQLYPPADVFLRPRASKFLHKEIMRRCILHNMSDMREVDTHNDIPKKNLRRQPGPRSERLFQRLPKGEVSHLPGLEHYTFAQCCKWLQMNPLPVEEHHFVVKSAHQWRRQLRDELGKYGKSKELTAALKEFDARAQKLTATLITRQSQQITAAIEQYLHQLAALQSDLASAPRRTEFEISLSEEPFSFFATCFITHDKISTRFHRLSYEISVRLRGNGDANQERRVQDFEHAKIATEKICKELDGYILVPTLSESLKINVNDDESSMFSDYFNDDVESPLIGTQLIKRKGRSITVTMQDGAIFDFSREDCFLLPIRDSSAKELALWIYGMILKTLDAQYFCKQGVATMEVAVAESEGENAVFCCNITVPAKKHV